MTTHFPNQCDVLIAGAGLAGMSAANEISTACPQLSVCVVSQFTPISTHVMGFSAPANPGDSPDLLFQDAMRAGAGKNDHKLVRRLADNALAELRRLEAMGLVFDKTPDGLYSMVNAVGSSKPRVVHHQTDTGKCALKLLERPVLTGRITQFIQAADGRIAAAVVDGRHVIRAKAFIVASGGFCGLWKRATWNANANGTAIWAAAQVGAKLRELACVQFEPTVAFPNDDAQGVPIISTILHEGARLLDRFGNSLLTPNVPPPPKRRLAEIIQACIDEGRGNDDQTVTYDLTQLDLAAFTKRYPGYLERYKTVAVSPDKLEIHVRPAAHTTLGGLRVDDECHTTVPGIFAAGEAMGGLHGKDRIGGNAGLETLVFGRIAGTSAAQFAQNAPELPPVPDPLQITQLPTPEQFKGYATLLQDAITVIPNAQRVQHALKQLDALPKHPFNDFIKEILLDALNQ